MKRKLRFQKQVPGIHVIYNEGMAEFPRGAALSRREVIQALGMYGNRLFRKETRIGKEKYYSSGCNFTLCYFIAMSEVPFVILSDYEGNLDIVSREKLEIRVDIYRLADEETAKEKHLPAEEILQNNPENADDFLLPAGENLYRFLVRYHDSVRRRT